MESTGLFERMTAARNILGLEEEATLAEIDARVKKLLKRWHPDCCGEDPARCTEMTRHILQASRLIHDYCAHYKYSFREQEVDKHLSPEEWWKKRFGSEPLWAGGGEAKVDDSGKGRRAMGKQR